MALKNMIKLKDKVTFGRAGDAKRAGTVVKLNPKTAYIKCSNGDVMGVTYGLIQKPGKRKAATKKAPSKKTKAKRNPYGSFSRGGRAPAKRTTAKKSTSRVGTYVYWLEKQTKTKLKQLDKAFSVLLTGSGKGLSGLKTKHTSVKKELRKRK